MATKTRKLVCCCGEFSANAGDYWNARKDKAIVCGFCGEPMELVETEPYHKAISDDAWISGTLVRIVDANPTYGALTDEILSRR